MKKALYLLLLALPAVFACTRQDVTVVETVQKVKILKGELTFPPTGGEDVFLISTEEQVTLEQDSPWCKATLGSDGRITVKTDSYDYVESRYAFIRLSCGDESYLLTVHQFGVMLTMDNSDAQFDNRQNTFERSYEGNYPISFESGEDWIHPRAEENKLVVEIDENESKDFRKGYIYYQSGSYRDSLAVIQFDPVEAGMLGDYNWNSTRISNNRAQALNAKLRQDENGKFFLDITLTTALVTTVEVQLNGFVMEMPLGGQIGTYTARGTTYYVFPIIAYTQILAYENATTTGTYPFVFSKNAAGKWVATADHSKYEGDIFMLAMWAGADHSGNSEANSLDLKDITLTHK